MKLLILLTVFIIGNLAAPSTERVLELWNNFKITHEKRYTEPEELKRFTIFQENLKTIEKHNELYKNGKTTYKMAINQFADMTKKEFQNYLTKFKYNPKKPANTVKYERPLNIELPEAVDWREQGAVTPVKNQGQCGSCWSFSATGTLEGINFLKTGQLLSLSEQELIDCSTDYGNAGCNGGDMELAFQYVTDNGIATEEAYPYEGIDDTCKDMDEKVVRTTGYVEISEDDEEALQSAIATVGPVAIAVDASFWQFYGEGIYYDTKCSPEGLNHGVVGVGYGSENGEDYWLIKNSWGEDWGENGYIKSARNRNNNCGVARDSSYPLL